MQGKLWELWYSSSTCSTQLCGVATGHHDFADADLTGKYSGAFRSRGPDRLYCCVGLCDLGSIVIVPLWPMDSMYVLVAGNELVNAIGHGTFMAAVE